MADLDPLLLARIQFAFTVSFHILFPAFTIGLASWLAVVEGLWLKTKKPVYKEIYKFWIKIFAVTFGMGVVSGVVMSYQFGTNWSVFSDSTGNVLGPLLGYEVLTAFFLESSFLGIMLFGWNRVSDKMHFASTVIVAVGTCVSAFWILSANSWMQTPQGFRLDEATGIMHPANWVEIVFNPSFPYRFAHMLTAAYLTTCFVIGGVGGWYLFRKKHVEHAKIMLTMAVFFAAVFAPLQIFIGDLHGLNTLKHQPAKVAAMEGHWETSGNVPLLLFGWPDEEAEETKYALEIPNGASMILTHKTDGEIKGLKEWAKEDRPPVAIVFWSFRIMVGIGILMMLTAFTGALLFLCKKLYTAHWFHGWSALMMPSGFMAVLAGWFVTEVGRQPWTVYGVLRTSQSHSPVLPEYIAISLTIFIVAYIFIFGMGTYYILKLIGKGPQALADKDDKRETYGSHGVETPAIAGDEKGAQ
ncbi:MAG: cytochrome ubiquinol oxidase subunit I [Micavibrio aeruginosavorus]|uniref:Cytochrome ubiquinol oxidase subunit I n=1 Tax=Micavibrio aeruginosavorus TaxID=349221 RepID=A0A2W5N4F9_9BACT|nr:MAG: cytochrome ubiquinol oxidase subunit I [Micavibrio aeruginosavorus]